MPIYLVSALIIGATIHAVNWDTYFFTIIPLKAKQIAGVAKPEELKEVAMICNKRQKYNCESQALEQTFLQNKAEYPGLLRVANIYIEQKKFPQAVQTFNAYYKAGGKDPDSRFIYARALTESGLVKEAQKQYDYLLKTDRQTQKYQVARAYVELLMRDRDYRKAKNIIETYRRAGTNSALFLEKEWQSIQQKL